MVDTAAEGVDSGYPGGHMVHVPFSHRDDVYSIVILGISPLQFPVHACVPLY